MFVFLDSEKLVYFRTYWYSIFRFVLCFFFGEFSFIFVDEVVIFIEVLINFGVNNYLRECLCNVFFFNIL